MLSGGTSNEGGIGVKIADGIYGKKGPIISAKQEFGKKLGTYEPDAYIEIEVNGGGKYDDRIAYFGNFSREQTGPDEYNGAIKGWGTFSEFDLMLQRLNIYEGMSEEERNLETETNPIVIPQHWLDALVGTPVYYLTHVSGRNPETGKPYYNSYTWIMPVLEGSEEEAKAAWEKAKSKLYQDDYNFKKLQEGRDALEAIADSNADFQYGANVANEPDDLPGLDDDLPI